MKVSQTPASNYPAVGDISFCLNTGRSSTHKPSRRKDLPVCRFGSRHVPQPAVAALNRKTSQEVSHG